MQDQHPSGTGADRAAIAAKQLAAEAALREMRTVFDGTLVLLKGLELSSRYPDPTDRPFGDIDVLTDEPDRLQATLIDLGYEAGERAPFEVRVHYHDVPLQHPGLPIFVEVHRNPGWLAGMTPPSLETLLAMTAPSATGIAGLMALESPAHAVYLAVHSWRHRPFWRPQDLDDIESLLQHEGTADEATRLAQDWGVSRIWSYYLNDIASRAGEARQKAVVRLFGKAPTSRRRRSARSDYLAMHAGQLFVDHPLRYAPDIIRKVRRDLQPLPGESRRHKARRILVRLT